MELLIKINRNIDQNQIKRAEEIFTELIDSGGLWGVKGGQTIIHFNSVGEYMGIQLSYWPKKRNKTP